MRIDLVDCGDLVVCELNCIGSGLNDLFRLNIDVYVGVCCLIGSESLLIIYTLDATCTRLYHTYLLSGEW